MQLKFLIILDLLQREQIAQKCEKRARTRTYKCIRKATGSYLPLFSQGFRVCLSPPCTDEPRLQLEPEDVIKVTRFRKHWLFGERVVNEIQQKEAITNKKALRGWFPRRCAIELIQPSQPITSEEEEDCDEFSADKQEQKHNKTKPATRAAETIHTNGNHRKLQQNGHYRKKIN